MIPLLLFGFAAGHGEGARVHVGAQLRRAAGPWYAASSLLSCSATQLTMASNWLLAFVS